MQQAQFMRFWNSPGGEIYQLNYADYSSRCCQKLLRWLCFAISPQVQVSTRFKFRQPNFQPFLWSDHHLFNLVPFHSYYSVFVIVSSHFLTPQPELSYLHKDSTALPLPAPSINRDDSSFTIAPRSERLCELQNFSLPKNLHSQYAPIFLLVQVNLTSEPSIHWLWSKQM